MTGFEHNLNHSIFMPKNTTKKKHIRILLIRFSSIGDIILTTPLVKALKEKYANIILDYLTLSDYGSLLKDNPCIDNLYLHERNKGLLHSIVKAVELKKHKYDYIFDLHRSTRSIIFRLFLKSKKKYKFKKNYIKRFLLTAFKTNFYKKPYTVVERYFNTAKALDIAPRGDTEIWLDLEEVKTALSKINNIAKTNYSLSANMKNGALRIESGIIRTNRRKVISLMPFAKWKTKEWGDDKFIELGRKLQEKAGALILILGGRDDAERAGLIAAAIGKTAVSLSGKLTLAETAVALSLSDCLVSNDTGVMHIGGAVFIPVIAIFGCTTEELGFFPYNTKGETVQVPLDCRPCTAKGLPRCPKKHFKCMNDIPADMVYSSVKRYM